MSEAASVHDPHAVVLVTDGETRAALAVVRALGRAGHTVHVTSASGRSLAGASRHAVRDHALPDAAADPDGWAKGLADLAASLGRPLVLPISEISLGSLYAAGLDRQLDAVCPDRDAYEAVVDKACLMGRAESLGLDVPRGLLLEDPAGLDALPPGFGYPVVLKARRSRFLRAGRWETGGAGIATSDDALRRLAAEPGMQGGALLQEFVPGRGEAVFLLAHEGICDGALAHRRLREKPPSGGVSVLRESIDPDPRLLDESRSLIAELRWTGVAMVEYRRAPDGRAVLMEINPRFWGSLQLAIDAGADFPAALVALHRTGVAGAIRARPGVRTRWLLGDLDHLLIGLRSRAARAATGRTAPALVRDFVASFFDGSRLEVLRRDDPRPFARELAGWLRALRGGATR